MKSNEITATTNIAFGGIKLQISIITSTQGFNNPKPWSTSLILGAAIAIANSEITHKIAKEIIINDFDEGMSITPIIVDNYIRTTIVDISILIVYKLYDEINYE